MLRGEGLVDVDTEAGSFAGVHQARFEAVRMGKYFVGFSRVRHIFLNSKIMNAEVKVQRGGHANGA